MHFNEVFFPKSIAIIGASRNEKTVGNDVVKNLATQGYTGKIYPVNPEADRLYGLQVFHSIDEIPGDVDMAVMAIPAKFVAASVEEVAKKKKAKVAVVISAGFKETGNLEIETNLAKVSADNDVTLIGPNCLGVINSRQSMNASFAALMPKIGNVAFMSQSGALCTAVLDYAKDLGLGFSKFISIGNKAMVKELDLIKYFFADDETKVIAMYSEDLVNAPEIIAEIKKQNASNNPKPVIIIKSGSTDEGASAIASHTGSLSGGDAAYNALFAQAGIIRASSISEMFNLAQVFSQNQLQHLENVAIITNAGGPGVITTDAVINNGLKLAKLSEDSKKQLAAILPPAASYKNPIDVLGDAKADRYYETLKIVVKDKNVDAILFILTPQSMTEVRETAEAIVEVMKTTKKAMVVSFMGQPTVEPGVAILRMANIPTSSFPEPGAKSLAALGKFHALTEQKNDKIFAFKDVDKAKVKKIFDNAQKIGKTSFPESEAIEILEAYKFPVLKSSIVTSAKEAATVCQKLGGKFAMKIVSQDILHKSDVGGVVLNVTSASASKDYENMLATVQKNKPQAKLDGALLVEMAPKGTEVILGVTKAAGLGTMIMFGLGGIYVEVLKDVSFGFAPLSENDGLRMINSLKTSEMFKGVRGEKERDITALLTCIGRLSQLVTDFPQISELDINPLLALEKGQGARVLDARIVIEK